MRGRSGPAPRGRAVSGERRAAARSALLLLVLNGRLKSYSHTQRERLDSPFCVFDHAYCATVMV